MKENRVKKWTLAALWAALITALTAVPAFADIIFEPKDVPEPIQPEPAPVPTTGPAVVSGQLDPTLLTVLIAAVVLIAAGVIAWVIVRRRRAE